MVDIGGLFLFLLVVFLNFLACVVYFLSDYFIWKINKYARFTAVIWSFFLVLFISLRIFRPEELGFIVGTILILIARIIFSHKYFPYSGLILFLGFLGFTTLKSNSYSPSRFRTIDGWTLRDYETERAQNISKIYQDGYRRISIDLSGNVLSAIDLPDGNLLVPGFRIDPSMLRINLSYGFLDRAKICTKDNRVCISTNNNQKPEVIVFTLPNTEVTILESEIIDEIKKMILGKQSPEIRRKTITGELIIKIKEIDLYDKPDHVSDMQFDLLYIKDVPLVTTTLK